VINKLDVKKIRKILHMSQSEFCLRFGFALRDLNNWERNTARPSGPARTLLIILEKIPSFALHALREAEKDSRKNTKMITSG